jgi:hypothetical protein
MKERKKNEEKSRKIDKIRNDNADILLFTNSITITLLKLRFFKNSTCKLSIDEEQNLELTSNQVIEMNESSSQAEINRLY